MMKNPSLTFLNVSCIKWSIVHHVMALCYHVMKSRNDTIVMQQATENYLGPIFGYIAKNFFILYVFSGSGNLKQSESTASHSHMTLYTTRCHVMMS